MPHAPDAFATSPEVLVVGLARTGDRDAFAELVRRKQSWLRGLMRRLCNDSALADDLAQQALLQVWRDIAKLRDPHKFDAWLRRLAMNVWHQHLRRADPLAHAQDVDEAPPQEASDSVVGFDLDRALAALTPEQRTCIVLSYHEGLSHGEIADATETPLGTVKSHIRRGTERLKNLMAAYETREPSQ